LVYIGRTLRWEAAAAAIATAATTALEKTASLLRSEYGEVELFFFLPPISIKPQPMAGNGQLDSANHSFGLERFDEIGGWGPARCCAVPVPMRHGPLDDTTRTGFVEADTVAHCDDSTEGDYVNSLTFTALFSGWTENRAVWNKSADAVLGQLQALEKAVPHAVKDFYTDNGGEFLNWALHRYMTGRVGRTRGIGSVCVKEKH
jgi:hypothetical protein